MGDMADYLLEQGMDALARHQSGMCEDFCQYCDEEDEVVAHPKPAARVKAAPKPLKRTPLKRGKGLKLSKKRIARSKKRIVGKYQHPLWLAHNKAFTAWWVARYGRDVCGECWHGDAEATHHDRYHRGRGVNRLLVPFEWMRRVSHKCHELIETAKRNSLDGGAVDGQILRVQIESDPVRQQRVVSLYVKRGHGLAGTTGAIESVGLLECEWDGPMLRCATLNGVPTSRPPVPLANDWFYVEFCVGHEQPPNTYIQTGGVEP